MKYSFIVVNLFDNSTRGTNESEIADSYRYCEDYIVLDVEHGTILCDDGRVEAIEEIVD